MIYNFNIDTQEMRYLFIIIVALDSLKIIFHLMQACPSVEKILLL